MEINSNLYKCFIKAYETKNISKAAEMLYISQPALTYNIKQLESLLGVELFIKHSRGVEPTAEANTVYKYATQAFNIISIGENSLQDYLTLKKGHIRIGCPSHVASSFLSKFLIDFKHKYPGITIEIVSNLKDEMLEKLFLRRLDFMIDFLPFNTQKYNDLTTIKLKSFTNCFVASPVTASKIPEINKDNFSKIPLVIQSKNTTAIQSLITSAKNNKINIIMETWATETMLSVVEQDMGVGYCVEKIAENKIKNGNLCKIKTTCTLPPIDLACAYYESTLTQASQKFIELFNQYIKE